MQLRNAPYRTTNWAHKDTEAAALGVLTDAGQISQGTGLAEGVMTSGVRWLACRLRDTNRLSGELKREMARARRTNQRLRWVAVWGVGESRAILQPPSLRSGPESLSTMRFNCTNPPQNR